MKYQKIAICKAFLPKTNCFCHPTFFYPPTYTRVRPTIPVVKNHMRDTKITTNTNPTRRATPHGRRGSTGHTTRRGSIGITPLFSFLYLFFYFLIITLILFVPIKDYYAHKLYEITRVRKMFLPINYFFTYPFLVRGCIPRSLVGSITTRQVDS
jgi:hypothetical protein